MFRRHLAIVLAVLTLSGTALADTATYSTLAAFMQNIRADFLASPLAGPVANLPDMTIAQNQYTLIIDGEEPSTSTVIRDPTFGVGVPIPTSSTAIRSTGRPISALFVTIRVVNPALQSSGGAMTIRTDNGETISFFASPLGSTFGLTTTTPFTRITFSASDPANTEYISNLTAGTAALAVNSADRCEQANTILQERTPFVTNYNTAELRPTSCDTAQGNMAAWFRYVAPAHGLVTFETCGCTMNSVLTLYDRCNGAPELACNDDACPDFSGQIFASRLTRRMTPNQVVYIRIMGRTGGNGFGELAVRLAPDCPGDINHNGTVTPQDVFEFLAAFFAACP